MTWGRLTGAPILAVSFTLLWSLGALSASNDPPSLKLRWAGTSNESFERLLAKSNPAAPPAYRAFRRLEGGLASAERRGWLEVWTEFAPGRGMTYTVVGEGGSEYVRNKALRSMLNSEQELLMKGRRLRASLDAKNYTFEDGGSTEDGLQRIVLKPARKSDGIVQGFLFLNPVTGLASRIEGRLVKSPSFWLRDVDIVYRFAEIGGHLLPVEMSSSGRVRMFGRSSFRMTYQYESIDGRPWQTAMTPALIR